MKCPACESNLHEITIADERIDLCLKCGGLWFDKGELKKVVSSLLGQEKILATEMSQAQPKNTTEAGKRGRRCPHCDEYMQTFDYYHNPKVTLDKCFKCDGIWADSNEAQVIAVYVQKSRNEKKANEALTKTNRKINKLKFSQKLDRPPSFFWFIVRAVLTVLSLLPLPIRDIFPTKRIAKVTITLIVLNVLAFIWEANFVLGDYKTFFDSVGVIPAAKFTLLRSYTFISSQFIHVSALHLAGNMYFLWIFGDNIEDKLGSVKFLFFYLTCGVAAGIMHCLMYPDSVGPLIGASGALAGIMAAYLILNPKIRLQTLWLGRLVIAPAWIFLAYWAGCQFIFGIINAGNRISNVAYWAHIGGLLCGFVLICALVKIPSKQY